MRDYTKGHPSISANNHPVRHGPVVGIHNGIIVNDDELLAEFDCARAEPRMTVDSEAIFALAAHSRNEPAALEALLGSMATAWLDEREPGTVFAARGIGRPLWLGTGKHELFFASTRTALEVVEEYADVRLKKQELKDGTFLALHTRRSRGTSASTRTRATKSRASRAPRRARAGRRRVLPAAAREPRGCVTS